MTKRPNTGENAVSQVLGAENVAGRIIPTDESGVDHILIDQDLDLVVENGTFRHKDTVSR